MKMIVFTVLSCTSFAYAQQISKTDIVGFWQEGDSVISSMYDDAYQFFDNGKFVFHTSQYDGIQRIKEIRGIYRLKRDTLFLTVTSTLEFVGGTIEQSELTTLSGQWELDNYKVEEVKQNHPAESQRITLEHCKKDLKGCLLLNKEPFYRIYSDPYKAQYQYNE